MRRFAIGRCAYSLACLGSTVQGADFVYEPPMVTEEFFAGGAPQTGHVYALGGDLGPNAIILAAPAAAPPDTLVWRHTYSFCSPPNGDGLRAVSSDKVDLKAIRFTASNVEDATADVQLWFVGYNGQQISKDYVWKNWPFENNELLVEGADLLGRLDRTGTIVGFVVVLTMSSGAAVVTKVDVQWEVASIEVVPHDPSVLFRTDSSQIARFDPAGGGSFTEQYIGWPAGSYPGAPQSWQLQEFWLPCDSSNIETLDIIYDEVPAHPFEQIEYRIWKSEFPLTLLRQETLAKVAGMDDPGTPGPDTLLHRYHITPLLLERGKYWITFYAVGEHAYFFTCGNSPGGIPSIDPGGAYGRHSVAFPDPGFQHYTEPPTMLKELPEQSPDHLYNASFTVRGKAFLYADCEDDGDLDIFDFLCFQSAWAAQNPYADCEDDADWDVFDFLCFQDLFTRRCLEL